MKAADLIRQSRFLESPSDIIGVLDPRTLPDSTDRNKSLVTISLHCSAMAKA